LEVGKKTLDESGQEIGQVRLTRPENILSMTLDK
jgi:hypothetical protein